MSVQAWTYIIVGLSFALYIYIAVRSRASNTGEFYVAGKGVSPLANGAATAADWMSAASFIGMAGLISFWGRDGGVFLMGWTGGYVLLALLLAPYLRKFGRFTVPDFIGDRYYSQVARVLAILCAIFVSLTYVAGQMRGVGVVFSRFLEVDINVGVIIGMVIVFFYAVLGGMKGITYTQVAQYCVLIFAFMVPAIFISIMLTNNPVPQLGLGGAVEGGEHLLDKLDGLGQELGFGAYTEGSRGMLDVFCITLALMAGTAGLPHVIVRFYTVRKVKDARMSAFWALLFISVLYTTAPAVAAFARTNLLNEVPGKRFDQIPQGLQKWEKSGLLAWADKNGDGLIQYGPGKVFADNDGKPSFQRGEGGEVVRGPQGQGLLVNELTASDNELYIDQDIMVLANPEIARLPNWVVGLVAAGGLAAALSTAAGLLLVISTAFAHDLMKKTINPKLDEKKELLFARLGAGVAVLIAGAFGIWPPGFVAQVVAFAFGLAAASFFPAILMGIFSKRMNREGVIAGMVVGLAFTAAYIIYHVFVLKSPQPQNHWWAGISPMGIGAVGMMLNFCVAWLVSRITPAPPEHVQKMVEEIRLPEVD